MSESGPIRDRELAQLFGPLHSKPIALAVSGGLDSVTLMRLVHRSHRQSGAPARLPDGRAPFIVLTVDHKLRAESTSEARWVEAEARALGFACAVLTWESAKPTSGIQEAARTARYRLIRSYIDAEGGTPPRVLVTAHHRDDQAETLLMRLARGSGLDGLSSMRPATEAHGLTILRPLLDVPKARLRATLEAEGATWLEDPSNASEAFERVRWRTAQPELDRLGLGSAPLALAARRLSRARDALEWATDDLAVRCELDLNQGAFARLHREAFDAAPEDLRVRLVTRLLAAYGDALHRPNLAQVEELCARLAADAETASTLSGCVVEASGSAIEVYREFGRTGLSEVTLTTGEPQTWDGRFTVSIRNVDTIDGVRVGALGEDGWRQIRDDAIRPRAMPSRAMLALPTFRSGAQILSVPHLAFFARNRDSASFVATFCWPWSAPERGAGPLPN